MLFEGKAGDDSTANTGSLMDTSINSAVLEFGFPVEFFLDMLCRCVYGCVLSPNLSVAPVYTFRYIHFHGASAGVVQEISLLLLLLFSVFFFRGACHLAFIARRLVAAPIVNRK